MSLLHYMPKDTLDYHRKKWGRDFTYRDINGKTITDREIRARIESLPIPPAWTDVWINPDQNSHILATGRDDAGRKQYCYHPLWRQQRVFDGIILVIYNVHPWPPLAWETGYNDESHRVVLQDIADRTFSEQLPLILAGDFNMTDSFEEYELFARRFTDSYRVAGDGIGYTFPNYSFKPFPAMLRLDYIWHSENFQSVESTVWSEHGQSDHSPVVSTLALSNISESLEAEQ